MPAHVLKLFLSPKSLQALAGDKVYARGEEYHQQKRVRILYHAPTQAAAEIRGSQPYRVEFGIRKGKLDAVCTCPAMEDFGFCKHAVAFGLALTGKAPTHKTVPKSQKPGKDLFAELYPNIAAWTKHGCIEIGRDEHSTSAIRVVDRGGVVWEGGTRHRTLDRILAEADKAIAEWAGGEE